MNKCDFIDSAKRDIEDIVNYSLKIGVNNKL